MFKRVLIFRAHPDDEIVMARTIARFSAQGTAVTVVILTNGCEGYFDPAWVKNYVRQWNCPKS